MPALAQTVLVSATPRIVALLGLTLVAACGRGGAEAPAGMFGGPAPVAVVAARPEAVPMTLDYTAQTQGSREVEVRARVAGILLKRNYVEGGRVRAGQSLFTLDPAPFAAALARAEADAAAVAARHAQARREAARLWPLYDAKAVSEQDYDAAVAAETIGAADLQAANARLREAQLHLAWTRVESPIAGIASRALKSEGSLITGPDVLLTTVTQTDPMHVIFGVPDNERLQLRREVELKRLRWPRDGRFTVTLRLGDGSEYARAGVTDFADVRVSHDTGTSEARAAIPNPDGILRAGEFVRVRLSGAVREAAFKLPQRAVQDGPQGKFVYVVGKENKAELRPVEVGEWSGQDIVVTAGLAAGEQVIVDGVLKLGPGAPVQIAPPQAAAPERKPGS
ncbi:MAG: efflux RND transporter periplasmic adaptor subunit [Rhodocyclales bacterium]|nr:efflux RND transporter periplasmic adaptor subunit [Rhodocyclales bacterium]